MTWCETINDVLELVSYLRPNSKKKDESSVKTVLLAPHLKAVFTQNKTTREC